MNNIMQQDVAEKKLINGRYQLTQCLFANHIGALYRAADNQKAAREAPVLVHLLPKRSISYEELPELFAALQRRSDDNGHKMDGCTLLHVLDCGWMGMAAYFVLALPDAHAAESVGILPVDTSGKLYQDAVSTGQELQQQNVIANGLSPQSFIVQAGKLYLLPTTLLAQFQTLLQPDELLSAQQSTDNASAAGRWLSLLGVVAVTGVVAGGGGYSYYLTQQDSAVDTVVNVATNTAPQDSRNAASATGAQSGTITTANNESTLAAAQQDVGEKTPSITLNDSESRESATLGSERATIESDDNFLGQTLLTNDKTLADTRNDAAASEALPFESPKDDGVEVNAMQQQDALPGPNIEPLASSPVVPEIAQPIVRHSDPVTPKSMAMEPAPILPALTNEAGEPEVLPVTTAMSAAAEIAQAAEKAAAEKAAAEQAAAEQAAAEQAAAEQAAAEQAAAEEEIAEPDAAEEEATEGEVAEPAVVEEEIVEQEVKKTAVNTKGELTTGGLTKDELVQEAYKAISADKLSEAAGKGAVYYIRLLKRLDRTNPQVKRLARQVVSAYHVKTRLAIKREHKLSAQRLLWVAGRLIKEFNLAQMNEAHAVLQHKFEDDFLK